ncbi:hypothetical protein SAMN05216190_14014 [Pseudomonas borbori]|uniref:Uncharacterized protein n=1 Tax=Pseudomonas borbori TaxID=289003 RepID=A0A1I5WIB3_9PSED|nr:hypothetical protein SAMN05216190_14014 [Pseudomonas borbori]
MKRMHGMTRDELLSAPESDYMNEAQLAFFKALLLAQLDECNEKQQPMWRMSPLSKRSA